MNDPHSQGFAAEFDGTERFEVIDQLGAGAMCVVYRARDRKHGDIVALKTLRHLDSNSLYRLKQEFRALSHFDHPNLVSFSELVFSEQGWFVTMELVEGVDFLVHTRGEEARESRTEGSTWSTQTGVIVGDETTEQLEQEPPDEPRGLPDLIKLRSAMRQLAEGVQTLHAAGRVHRDLKPSNVLVTAAGRVVILDFGLVAEIDQDYTEGTLHQNIAGSAAYMSPEQSVGRPLAEGSDWYSVGVMLYEALTGVWPYQGHLYQILTKKQEEDPPAPNTLVEDVPQDLNDLAMALLSRDPDGRPSGADVVAFFRAAQPEAVHQRVLQPRFRFREAQLDLLRRGFQVSKGGRAVTILVRGIEGTGKTKLIREFIKDLKRRESLVVLKGQCFEWESLPYKAMDGLMDNLSRVLRRLDHRDVTQLTNAGLPYLAHLFPVLNRVDAFGITEPADLDRLDEGGLRQRAFEGLFQLLREVSRQIPVLIFLDDAQWGDELSAAVLGEILKFSADLPIQVLLAYNVDQPGPFIPRFLQPVQEAGVPVEAIDLLPLTFEQATVIAGEMLDLPVGDDRVRQIALDSEGVPQFIWEHVKQLAFEAGRESLADEDLNEVTVSEISNLPESSQRLLSLLCLCDQPLPDHAALIASGLADDAFQAISTLRAHHLINVAGLHGQDALQVGSEAVRDYVVDRIPEDWKVGFHRSLAQAMESDGSNRPESIIKHYIGAHLYKKAGVAAWLAANAMIKEGQSGEAVWLLGMALQYGEWTAQERGRILTHHGNALAMSGAGKKAADAMIAAAQLLGGPKAQALTLRASEQLFGSGYFEEAEAQLGPLLEGAEVSIKTGGGWFGGLFGRKPKWRSLDFVGVADGAFQDDQLFQIDLAWTAAMGRRLVDAAEGQAAQQTHLSLALELGEPERALRALAAEVRFQGEQGEDDWRERFEHVTQQAKGRKSRSALTLATAAAAAAALAEGAWVDAVNFAESAENMFAHNKVGVAWERYQCRAIAAFAHFHRGDWRAAAAKALPLVRELEHAENRLFLTMLHAGVVAWLRIAEDDADTGLAQLAQTPQELVSKAGIPFFHLLVTWTHLQIYKGQNATAWGYLEERWGPAERGMDTVPRRLQAEAWLTRARAAVATGDVIHLRAARGALAAAEKLDLDWVAPWVALIELGCQALEGRATPVPEALAAQFQATDQSVGSAVVLALTESGRDQAHSWLVDQGVKEPAQLVRMFAPGL